ncbi:shikimate dehydrogenase [Buchnera aphidicola (Hyadaphis tataricae)]|uniref:Shikimate dehydrogenase (NADP(+)) n=1 Tax=Buchnera aphidicola (Hyadaphis tataricae) TaxID=1241859 RepID=A0A4D6Y784_9GAMM|nr:shikimate dehydrogenase [Buchnera aphidicola]QCI21770.1 shikimate dehydrogenase [Buchnera aphidicola (Hyadaphis tataricae)]
MFKNQKYNYAVFGNPVNHSKSPNIHSYFAKQTDILHIYKSVHVPLNNFYFILRDFFQNQGQGANITAPFKQEAFFFADKLTDRAKISQSVNTLKKIDNKYILGDNTDGIGLFSDLKRLNFIKCNDLVLILGAGGGAKGILFPLLSFGCSVFILNRTVSKSQQLISHFSQFGKISMFEKCLLKEKKFNLVINATSQYDKNMIDLSLFSQSTCFYDMNYQKNNTYFLDACIASGMTNVSNGIGMLIFQAAHSFFLWHNVFPNTDDIINTFQKTCLVHQNDVIK